MNHFIIALTGKKRSGKDTAAQVLIKHHNFIKISFAEPLKQISKILFNFTDNQLEGDEKETIDKRINYSPREIMQLMGTEIFRNQLKHIFPKLPMYERKENIWTSIVRDKIKFLVYNSRVKVITNADFTTIGILPLWIFCLPNFVNPDHVQCSLSNPSFRFWFQPHCSGGRL